MLDKPPNSCREQDHLAKIALNIFYFFFGCESSQEAGEGPGNARIVGLVNPAK